MPSRGDFSIPDSHGTIAITQAKRKKKPIVISGPIPTIDQNCLKNLVIAHPMPRWSTLNIVRDRDSQILDMGCGTGIVGELLFSNGYQNIDGSGSFSPEMLQKARERNVYRSLGEADLFWNR